MLIQIDKITEHEDESATLDISYDKEFASLIKKEYKIKKITNKLLQKFILDLVKNA